MRVQLGGTPEEGGNLSDPPGWTRIRSPASFRAHLASWLTGMAALALLLSFVLGGSLLRSAPPGQETPDGPTSWLAVVATLVLAVPAHEFFHALFYPGGVRSPRITLFLWPRRLQLGVYYEGTISRERWLAVRLAPFALLAVVPAVLLLALPLTLVPETVLSLLILVNALGSGGDLVSAGWVLMKIPPRATMGFFSKRAFFRMDPPID